ncbi:DegV family protein with EDD domain [Paenibacillus shirakamiensis]|uniref:DegV family protein with EDD domain n=1 Tax=Paenibacillus shirakamiensis TaxID=1265935 RepID=A0ABS4JFA6_9BACL|nr:DegV family protein [Paenibacillus shirakamiensis]MBP2000378.1 DegV family protein with EDD domain [Paenibacillus shirakamiensis]
MKSVAWVTDSTCTVDPIYAKENHIYIVPLRLMIGEECYRETIDITADEFYEKMKTHEKVGSSQPPIGEFLELYENLKQNYDEIIAIHCSSELSGTMNTSLQAAEMAEIEVTSIDSKAGAFPLREMIMKGVQWHKMGQSVHEIKEKIEQMAHNVAFYVIPTSMQQLHRSGRVSGTQLLVSQLLRIHLLLKFDKGKVIVEDKIRTFKKTKQRMMDHLKSDIGRIKEVCIMHANNLDEAKEIEQEISIMDPALKTEIMTFIPVVGILAGEGTVALSWIRN